MKPWPWTSPLLRPLGLILEMVCKQGLHCMYCDAPLKSNTCADVQQLQKVITLRSSSTRLTEVDVSQVSSVDKEVSAEEVTKPSLARPEGKGGVYVCRTQPVGLRSQGIACRTNFKCKSLYLALTFKTAKAPSPFLVRTQPISPRHTVGIHFCLVPV